jgi:tetratricopeptide (TPR) repeat protein
LLPAASSASAGTRVLDTPNEPTTNGSAINGPAENGSATTGEALDVAASGNAAGGDEQLSPAEVEMRRARQLLDRSFSLSERGDLAGAILACRQAISLVPDLAEAHSMLGLLLERTGDTKGAIEAYEETLLLAPDSLLERDSLQRLRAQMPQQSATPFFRFDDSELFPETPGRANDFMTPAPNGAAVENAPNGAAVAAASAAQRKAPMPCRVLTRPGVALNSSDRRGGHRRCVPHRQWEQAAASAATTDAREISGAPTTNAAETPVPASLGTHLHDTAMPRRMRHRLPPHRCCRTC